MPGTVSSANWPAAKSSGLVEIHVEGEHVVGEPPAAPHDAAQRPRRAGAARLLERRPDLEHAVLVGDALAHQELGLGLEIPMAGRLGPLRRRAPARPSRALHVPQVPVPHSYGQLDPAPQAGEQDLLPGRALEVARPVAGVDDDLHRRSADAGRLALGVPGVDLRDLLVALVERLGGLPVLDQHALDHLGDDVRVQHLAGRRRRRAARS